MKTYAILKFEDGSEECIGKIECRHVERSSRKVRRSGFYLIKFTPVDGDGRSICLGSIQKPWWFTDVYRACDKNGIRRRGDFSSKHSAANWIVAKFFEGDTVSWDFN